MNDASTMILIGIGGGGAAIARGIRRAFGEDLRSLSVDTDATAGQSEDNFLLLGGDRLSGRGAGGDIVLARLAAEDSIGAIDPFLEGVRLAVVVTSLGGGTGGGATLEVLRRLGSRGIPSIVFATTPFAFEGADRQRAARGIMPMIEELASATFFMPLDKLVGDAERFDDAMRRAIDTMASAVTLFWRLVGKPGYIRLDVERIRHLVSKAGRGRFATVSSQGPGRAAAITDALVRSPLLAAGSGPVRAMLCGVLAGDDLRLGEIGEISDGICKAFGAPPATLELATVNDEEVFSGRISVALLLFEGDVAAESDDSPSSGARPKRGRKSGGVLAPKGSGRFNNAEPTIWNGEDLDIPTFLRRNINLDI